MFVPKIPQRTRYASSHFHCQRRFLALVSDPSMVEDSRAPESFDKRSAVVYPNAVSASERDALLTHIEPLLKRYALSVQHR